MGVSAGGWRTHLKLKLKSKGQIQRINEGKAQENTASKHTATDYTTKYKGRLKTINIICKNETVGESESERLYFIPKGQLRINCSWTQSRNQWISERWV